ncbi:unnamed protein product, partial [Laminaria digitata]
MSQQGPNGAWGDPAGVSGDLPEGVAAAPPQGEEHTGPLESEAIRITQASYDEKVHRLTQGLKKAKPSKAKADVWAYFQVYADGKFSNYAICMICMRQKAYEKAEIKYASSPSNLVSHLKTGLPEHKAAWADLQRRKARRGNNKGEAYA